MNKQSGIEVSTEFDWSLAILRIGQKYLSLDVQGW